jgi:hypothetical protein
LKKGTEKQALKHHPFPPRKKLKIFVKRRYTKKHDSNNNQELECNHSPISKREEFLTTDEHRWTQIVFIDFFFLF